MKGKKRRRNTTKGREEKAKGSQHPCCEEVVRGRLGTQHLLLLALLQVLMLWFYQRRDHGLEGIARIGGT